MYKHKWFIVIGVLLCVGLVLWIRLYADDYDAYDSGKFTYETVGEWGHTLADAHGYFVKADSFWDSEDYIRKIEDEMYVAVEEAVNEGAFARDGVMSSITALKSSVRYKDIAEDWAKQREEHFDYQQAQLEKKIARNPPYEGMSSSYIDDTAWGPSTSKNVNTFSYETRGSITYYWVDYEGHNKKVKAVYISEGKVIKVSDY